MPIKDPLEEQKNEEMASFQREVREKKKEMTVKRKSRKRSSPGKDPKDRPVGDSFGGNQNKTDPRQELFLKLYQSPASPTFGNANQSALKAGYSPWYANGILTHGKNWILSKRNQERRVRMLEKSETNLEGFLTDKPKTVEDRKLKFNATVFALKTLGKEIYSEKSISETSGEVRHVLDASQAERILQRRMAMGAMGSMEVKTTPEEVVIDADVEQDGRETEEATSDTSSEVLRP